MSRVPVRLIELRPYARALEVRGLERATPEENALWQLAGRYEKYWVPKAFETLRDESQPQERRIKVGRWLATFLGYPIEESGLRFEPSPSLITPELRRNPARRINAAQLNPDLFERVKRAADSQVYSREALVSTARAAGRWDRAKREAVPRGHWYTPIMDVATAAFGAIPSAAGALGWSLGGAGTKGPLESAAIGFALPSVTVTQGRRAAQEWARGAGLPEKEDWSWAAYTPSEFWSRETRAKHPWLALAADIGLDPTMAGTLMRIPTNVALRGGGLALRTLGAKKAGSVLSEAGRAWAKAVRGAETALSRKLDPRMAFESFRARTTQAAPKAAAADRISEDFSAAERKFDDLKRDVAPAGAAVAPQSEAPKRAEDLKAAGAEVLVTGTSTPPAPKRRISDGVVNLLTGAYDHLPYWVQSVLPFRMGRAEKMAEATAEAMRAGKAGMERKGRPFAAVLRVPRYEILEEAARLKGVLGVRFKNIAKAMKGEGSPRERARAAVERLLADMRENPQNAMAVRDEFANALLGMDLARQFSAEATRDVLQTLDLVGHGERALTKDRAIAIANSVLNDLRYYSGRLNLTAQEAEAYRRARAVAEAITETVMSPGVARVFDTAAQNSRLPEFAKTLAEIKDAPKEKRFYPVTIRYDAGRPQFRFGREALQHVKTERARAKELEGAQSAMTLEEILADYPKLDAALDAGVIRFVEATPENEKALKHARALADGVFTRFVPVVRKNLAGIIASVNQSLSKIALTPLFRVPLGRYGALSPYHTQNIISNLVAASLNPKFDLEKWLAHVDEAARYYAGEPVAPEVARIMRQLEEEGVLQGINQMAGDIAMGKPLPSSLDPRRWFGEPFSEIPKIFSSKAGKAYQGTADISLREAAIQDAVARYATYRLIIGDRIPERMEDVRKAVRQVDAWHGNMMKLAPIATHTAAVLRFFPWVTYNMELWARQMLRHPARTARLYARTLQAGKQTLQGGEPLPTFEDLTPLEGTGMSVQVPGEKRMWEFTRLMPWMQALDPMRGYIRAAVGARDLVKGALEGGRRGKAEAATGIRNVAGVAGDFGYSGLFDILNRAIRSLDRSKPASMAEGFARAFRPIREGINYERILREQGPEEALKALVAGIAAVGGMDYKRAVRFAIKELKRYGGTLTPEERERMFGLLKWLEREAK